MTQSRFPIAAKHVENGFVFFVSEKQQGAQISVLNSLLLKIDLCFLDCLTNIMSHILILKGDPFCRLVGFLSGFL